MGGAYRACSQMKIENGKKPVAFQLNPVSPSLTEPSTYVLYGDFYSQLCDFHVTKEKETTSCHGSSGQPGEKLWIVLRTGFDCL